MIAAPWYILCRTGLILRLQQDGRAMFWVGFTCSELSSLALVTLSPLPSLLLVVDSGHETNEYENSWGENNENTEIDETHHRDHDDDYAMECNCSDKILNQTQHNS